MRTIQTSDTRLNEVYPFSELPLNRDSVDWNSRGVDGWGIVYLPSLTTSDAQHGMLTQEDVTEWLNDFIKRYGEAPVIELNPDNPWFSKAEVTNKSFNQWREKSTKAKAACLREMAALGHSID